jgi:elongation factor G
MAFQLAARAAVRACAATGATLVLEPRVLFRATCPEESTGAVVGDVVRRRGEIRSIESSTSGLKEIEGIVPLVETFGWTNDLRSLTSGRASVSLEPFDHAPAPVGSIPS